MHSIDQNKSESKDFFDVSTLIIVKNVSRAKNKHFKLISEGSCDTEDWINCNNISQYTSITVLLHF